MFSSRPLKYLTAALFIVMLISAFYLEFPAITALVLTIGVAIWLWSRDGQLPKMPLLSSAPRAPSFLSVRPEPSRTMSARLLSGLTSFSLEVKSGQNWRYPRARGRVKRIARDVLENHDLRCLEGASHHVRSADCARLYVDVVIEPNHPYSAITITASVEGLVEAHRTGGSVSDLVTLWTYQQSRLTTADRVVFELEDCTRSCLYRLISELGGRHV